MRLIQQIMERLELALHPTKTRIVGLWDGKGGFGFLGMHFRKAKAENAVWCVLPHHTALANQESRKTHTKRDKRKANAAVSARAISCFTHKVPKA
jgi:hypothetical protein